MSLGVGRKMKEAQKYSVVSVMGPHAGEDSDTIFTRKIADIRNAGRTFWVIRSHKAKPNTIQAIGSAIRERSGDSLCAFLAPSSPGGAVPTKTSSAATKYSNDTSTHPDRMKSHIRQVVAIGRLVEPFAVWLK